MTTKRWSLKAEKKRRETVVSRIKTDAVIQEALALEPDLQQLFDEAIRQEYNNNYNRILTYYNLKEQAERYVGWTCRNPKLKTMAHHDAVVGTLMDMLPADKADRYSQ